MALEKKQGFQKQSINLCSKKSVLVVMSRKTLKKISTGTQRLKTAYFLTAKIVTINQRNRNQVNVKSKNVLLLISQKMGQ